MTKKNYIILIIVYVLVIYATLPLMRPALNFLYKVMGRFNLSILVNILLIGSVSVAMYSLINSLKGRTNKVIPALVILSIGLFVIMGYDRPEERLHFLEYGLLGYMVFSVSLGELRMPSIFSFLFVSLVGIGDETIQYFLPNRVGDLRDVFMNCFGGLLGISIARIKKC